VLAILLFIPAFIALLLFIEVLAERHDDRRYPAPGRLVPINSQRCLHVVQHGTQQPGRPVVILEAGLAATSLSWLFAPPLLAEFSQVVSYDRAGLGRSSPSGAAPTLNGILADLDALTQTLPLTPPFIMVGHSFGGLIVRAFAHLHPQSVAGLVLVDPVSLTTYATPDRQHARRLLLGTRLSRRGAWMARFAIVRTALWLVANGSRKLPAFIARVSAGKGSSVMDRLAGEIAKLPPETHGPIRAHWSKPDSFKLMAEYLRLVPAAASQGLNMPVPAHIPIIVLSAASAGFAIDRSAATRRFLIPLIGFNLTVRI
jgi:pimeloyl-ACP methyl ester carboxylesterase